MSISITKAAELEFQIKKNKLPSFFLDPNQSCFELLSKLLKRNAVQLRRQKVGSSKGRYAWTREEKRREEKRKRKRESQKGQKTK